MIFLLTERAVDMYNFYDYELSSYDYDDDDYMAYTSARLSPLAAAETLGARPLVEPLRPAPLPGRARPSLPPDIRVRPGGALPSPTSPMDSLTPIPSTVSSGSLSRPGVSLGAAVEGVPGAAIPGTVSRLPVVPSTESLFGLRPGFGLPAVAPVPGAVLRPALGVPSGVGPSTALPSLTETAPIYPPPAPPFQSGTAPRPVPGSPPFGPPPPRPFPAPLPVSGPGYPLFPVPPPRPGGYFGPPPPRPVPGYQPPVPFESPQTGVAAGVIPGKPSFARQFIDAIPMAVAFGIIPTLLLPLLTPLLQALQSGNPQQALQLFQQLPPDVQQQTLQLAETAIQQLGF